MISWEQFVQTSRKSFYPITLGLINSIPLPGPKESIFSSSIFSLKMQRTCLVPSGYLGNPWQCVLFPSTCSRSSCPRLGNLLPGAPPEHEDGFSKQNRIVVVAHQIYALSKR